MKCKDAIRPSKGAADRNLRLVHRSPPERLAISSAIRTVGWRKFMQRRDVTRTRRISGTIESVAKPQLSDIKPKVLPRVPHLFSAVGPIFLQTCALYWGCRFAGYGNK
jgi:hypothetical protein